MSPLKILCFGLLSGILSFQPANADDSTSESGTWQKHEYDFHFLGFTSTYSCDGLADKLKVLLLAAGARSDVKATPGACSRGFGEPDKFAQARVTFYTLASNTDGKGANVAATWRPVVYRTHSPRELGNGDCELIEQFRDSVLPMFNVRNVDNHVTCVPHQESGSVIDLKFESLQPLKPEKGPAGK